MPLKQLTRKVRRALGLTQEQFSQKLVATRGSVQNWESGRKRPAPGFLKKMAELAPAFGEEIDCELRAYEWHPRAKADSNCSPEAREELVAALHLILDRAPSEMVKSVAEFLTIRAGKYGSPPDRRPAVIPAKDRKAKR